MSPTGYGALAGLLGGIGLATIVRYLPVLYRPSLEQRVLPYINDVAKPSTLLAQMQVTNPLTVLERLLAPWVAGAAGILERLTGSAALTRKRLDASGSWITVEQFRAQQLVFGVLGLAGGLFLALTAAWRGQSSLIILLAMVVLGGVGAVIARDWLLTQAVNRRRSLILVEFPTVADLLALSVGAGEGPVPAMERVAQATNGELSKEFGRVIADVRAGGAVVSALSRMASRVDMVPVVFLVLPITVLFAIYPGMVVLSMGM